MRYVMRRCYSTVIKTLVYYAVAVTKLSFNNIVLALMSTKLYRDIWCLICETLVPEFAPRAAAPALSRRYPLEVHKHCHHAPVQINMYIEIIQFYPRPLPSFP